ncbi:LysR family transcriptional regulator [Enterovibrio norvegicus]|uniref:LysR family transcriptional regulator n=1 Tax=Enterovibrio norvegicus TaxID=188144 RepID=UPI000C82C681|nr:LysR family transcriptional regulator [Enterovibrio norvegicus]PMN72451.1 LysR family transcriptional regulator [Enterovibrio norvegicus]
MSTNKDPLNDNLADIRAFVAIAESGSFSKAAEKLGASRAHMSRQLSQLESRLGVQLIIRTTRSQRLTTAGDALFTRCQAAMMQIDDAISDAIDDSDQLRGRIAVNCVGGILGESLVGDVIHRFCFDHPDIHVELDFSSERVDLIESRFDLVLRMGALNDSRLIGRYLGDIEIGTYAAPHYLSQRGRLAHPRDLQKHDCLTGSVTRWRYVKVDAHSQHVDVDVKGNLQCKNGHVLMSASLQGNGICRLPALYCESHVQAGRLENVFTDWGVEKVPLYLLYHKDRHQPKRLKALIQRMVAEVPPQLS